MRADVSGFGTGREGAWIYVSEKFQGRRWEPRRCFLVRFAAVFHAKHVARVSAALPARFDRIRPNRDSRGYGSGAALGEKCSAKAYLAIFA